MATDPEITAEEIKAGFSVQTLIYPNAYELPFEVDESYRQYERAVAICIDDDNRIKRRRSGVGYVHEHGGENGWTVAAEFETLADVVYSAVYGEWKDSQEELFSAVDGRSDDEQV